MRRLVLTALIALLAVPATAGASVDAIYEDCQDGRLDKRHSKSDLRKALKGLRPGKATVSITAVDPAGTLNGTWT